ncbi:MAG: GIY-YIG nuclease family protein [Phycisphaerae bacterium]
MTRNVGRHHAVGVPAFTYILRCGDGGLYVGITTDLVQRLDRHARGHVASTRERRPARLAWFEEFETLLQARQKERSLKGGRTRRKKLDQMLSEFPANRLAPFVADASQG